MKGMAACISIALIERMNEIEFGESFRGYFVCIQLFQL